MAVVMLQYEFGPSPLNQARLSGMIQIPPAANGIKVYFVASQGNYEREEFSGAIALQTSANKRDFSDFLPTNGTGASDSIAPRAAGMEAGQIPADMSENFAFLPGSAISIGTFSPTTGPGLGMQWVRIRITPLTGNTEGGIFCAAVIEAFDFDGEPMQWDTTKRAA